MAPALAPLGVRVGPSDRSGMACCYPTWEALVVSCLYGGGMRLDGGCGCAGSSAMDDLRRAALHGDLAEVQRLVGEDPGLLNATDNTLRRTPLMWACDWGHVGVVRWLLDQGAATNMRAAPGNTALWFACCNGSSSAVMKLLLERGADPTIADEHGWTPLMAASWVGSLEIVCVLLGRPSARATINQRDTFDQTALWWACFRGRGGVVRALLQGGADPTIANNDGTTPMAIAKQVPPDQDDNTLDVDGISAEGRRECVAALEVSLFLPLSFPLLGTCSPDQLAEILGTVIGRRQSGRTCCGRPGRWPTSRGAARWR
jgi:hypothetical protein